MNPNEAEEIKKNAVEAQVQDCHEEQSSKTVPETPKTPVEVKKNAMQIVGDWIQSKQIAKAEKKAAKKAKAEEKKAKKDKLVTAAAWVGGLAVAGRVAVAVIDAVGRNRMDDYPTEEAGVEQETLELPESTETGTAEEEIPAEVNET